MKVIEARNVHAALPAGLRHLAVYGVQRPSRAGMVVQSPMPVTTMYRKPIERVVFWPERDANAAFHLAEALWMLAGRNDLAFLTRYIKDFGKFSDDGQTLHGAYGHRWRRWGTDRDQLAPIAEALQRDQHDRRCVLAMWNPNLDLGRAGKDVPCNLTAAFQVNPGGALDLTVFCRSNDAILGAYGANAVHFSLLQEYMAGWIGCSVGTYYQVSVNFHAYAEPFERLQPLMRRATSMTGLLSDPDPYASGGALVAPMFQRGDDIHTVDAELRHLLTRVDSDFKAPLGPCTLFFRMADAVLHAFHLWRHKTEPERFTEGLAILADPELASLDWAVAMTQWLTRRQEAWQARMAHADPQQA